MREDLGEISSAASRMEETLDRLVEQIAQERIDAIEQLRRVVASERSAAIAEAARAIAVQRQALFAELPGLADELLPLVNALSASSSNLREMTRTLDDMDAARILSMDAAELTALAKSVESMTAELGVLVQSTRSLLGDEQSAAGLERIEGAVRGMELRLLTIGIVLILFAGAVALAVIVLGRRWTRA
jgi:hypothetical protein